jgi:protocatechuate 3,4-dioxygenase beta subunit
MKRTWLFGCLALAAALGAAGWWILRGEDFSAASVEADAPSETQASQPEQPPGSADASDPILREPLAQSAEPAPSPASEAQPPQGIVTGHVVDQTNRPLAGATVELRAKSTLSARSGAAGEFSFAVAFGVRYTLVAQADQYVPFSVGGIGAGDDVACVLDRGRSVRGQVTSAELETPIAGALVVALSGPSPASTKSAADGTFQLDALGDDAVIGAIAEGYEPAMSAVPMGDEPLALALVPGTHLAGRVIDRATDEPLAGATVTYRLEAARPGSHDASAAQGVELVRTTDASGGFAFEQAGLNGARLVASAAGHDPVTREKIAADDADAVELRLSPQSPVRGTVMDAGHAPIAGATVEVTGPSSGPRASTGDDGRFTLDGVLPGSILRTSHPRYAPTLTETGPSELAIVLGSGATLSGTVLGPDSAPFAGASVVLAPRTHPELITGETLWLTSEADGRFTFAALPAGDYRLTVRAGDLAALPNPIQLAEGDQREITVDLHASLTITGYVQDTLGRPVAAALVTTRFQSDNPQRPELRGLLGQRASTDELGAFTVRGLLPDTLVDLEATRPGYAPGRVRKVPPGASDVLVRLTTLGMITGRVRDAMSNRPVEVFDITLAGEDRNQQTRHFSTSDGSFLVTGLKPGRYQVRARAEDYRGAAAATCELAEHLPARDVDFLLVPGGVIRGVVEDTRGVPVRRLPVQLRRKPTPRDRAPRPQVVFTGADGSFRFTELKNGSWELWVGHAKHPLVEMESLELVEGQAIVRHYTVSTLGRLEILVRDELGAPATGASVSLAWRDDAARGGAPVEVAKETIGKEGRAMLDNILPGDYQLTVTHNVLGQCGPLAVQVPPSAGTTREVVLRKRGS